MFTFKRGQRVFHNRKQEDRQPSFSQDEIWRDYYLRLRMTCLVNLVIILFVYGLTLLARLLLGLYASDFTPGHLLLVGGLFYIAFFWAVNKYHYRKRLFSPKIHLCYIGTGLYLCNLVAVTIMIHLTGGVESVYPILYVVIALVGSFIAPQNLIAPLAVLGIIFHAVILLAEQYGGFPPLPTGLFVLSDIVPRDTATFIVVTLNSAMTLLGLFFGRRLFWLYESQREQVAEARANLERLVEERTHELNRTLMELRSTYDSLDKEKQRQESFFAHLTHQFRTPIHVINNFVSNFLSGVYGPITQKQSEALHHLSISSQNLLNLINNLLDMAKVHFGKIEFHAEVFSIREEVEKIVTSMRPLAEARGVQIHYEVSDEIPEQIETDRMKLEAILTNLLHNAIKFSKDSPVYLRLRRPTNDGVLVFQVEDFGKGISLEHKEKIFEAFAELPHSKEFRGSGLGLYIARSFANMMGGDVRLVEKALPGTIFEFHLPIKKGGAPERNRA